MKARKENKQAWRMLPSPFLQRIHHCFDNDNSNAMSTFANSNAKTIQVRYQTKAVKVKAATEIKAASEQNIK